MRRLAPSTRSPTLLRVRRKAGFAFTKQGPEHLSQPLAEALHAQWAFGFPTVPRGFLQLTHGFCEYPAGMQPVAAQHLLRVLPPGTLIDPFVGSGTTLIEAMRSGRTAIGSDISPLALFVARHQTWRPTEDELGAFCEEVRDVILAVDPLHAPFPAGECVEDDRSLLLSNIIYYYF